jgi:hypothetical protein
MNRIENMQNLSTLARGEWSPVGQQDLLASLLS